MTSLNESFEQNFRTIYSRKFCYFNRWYFQRVLASRCLTHWQLILSFFPKGKNVEETKMSVSVQFKKSVSTFSVSLLPCERSVLTCIFSNVNNRLNSKHLSCTHILIIFFSGLYVYFWTQMTIFRFQIYKT
jgi:hypothetical protein